MSTSLWAVSAEELLRRTASSDPTPGGGSIAAISGAFGIGLLQMAVAVTGDPELDDFRARLRSLQQSVVPAADGDAEAFEALMAAYRMPRRDQAQRDLRSQAVERRSVAAAEGPLAIASALTTALALSRELEQRVKPGIVSDVLAGRDLIVGAAHAAVRTADINIDALTRANSATASALRNRRNTIVDDLEATA